MYFKDQLALPGEHQLMLPGKAGMIEAVLTVPSKIVQHKVAFLGHPHSLQGGTMNNKVVTSLARACVNLGIPALRFNFRGVGKTTGQYDAGIGESEDFLTLVDYWQTEQPQSRFIFAGFSFGSYVAYRAAGQHPQAILMTIAPPVHHYQYTPILPNPWLIIQGIADEVVPIALVRDFARQRPAIAMIEFPDTGHFFHGQLIALKTQVSAYLQRLLTDETD